MHNWKGKKMENKLNFYSNAMRKIFFLAVTSLILFTHCKEPASLNALVVSDRQDNSNKYIQTILENSGLFDVDIENGASPSFSKYDLVVMNLEKGSWEADTKEVFKTM